MTPRKFFAGRAIGIIIVLATLGLVGGFYAFNNYIYQQKQGTGNAYEPYRGTLTGEYVCLPHRDTTGPQTEECAFGIKTDAGEYYALDFNLMSQMQSEFRAGDHFTASGIITPVERLSTDQWRIYPIAGIFSVTDSVKKE